MIALRLIPTAGTMFFILLMFSSQVLAHGVEGTVQPGGLMVACQYSTGEPMSYAKVTVLAPASSQPFQVGHTDKNGRFCFYPDALGEWRVTADDGMGHRLEVKVPVKDLEATKQILPPPGAASVSNTMSLRVLTGLSVIFGLSGFLFWFQGIRSKRGCKKPQS
jgi:nickel transport protein